MSPIRAGTALPTSPPDSGDFEKTVRDWREFDRKTEATEYQGVAIYRNEFWTSKQRAGHPLHEISYRACFKPQLPGFFIDRLTQEGEAVFDPFMGRGTTVLEARLKGRRAMGSDINPLSRILLNPRLTPPSIDAIGARIKAIDFSAPTQTPDELLVFYHPDTLRQICALREYLLGKTSAGTLDNVDEWIRMVAVNRLSGHSSGFFSVYSLPPNQAVSLKAQARINTRRKQTPPSRNVPTLILKKSRSLLRHPPPPEMATSPLLFNAPSHNIPEIENASVSLVVTSPPFLDVVDYQGDNWLRGWFCGIDMAAIPVANHRSIDDWTDFTRQTFQELARITRPGGHVAFEVGEVRGGKVALEETVLKAVQGLAFRPVLVLINDQKFTKTANCWGVANNSKGTNTNRIVLLQKT
ncbi:MAG: site-specific DNA-methyltransferase [Rhodospirillaceae bacterium]|jgi:DNA modification methylase|nr:site-specific DNA-methyltransferase [Rhodospirillaceae bacterium]MBT5659832.1 site-specific DNA-methyltransferase [Rhodospirillaceae bacterium]